MSETKPRSTVEEELAAMREADKSSPGRPKPAAAPKPEAEDDIGPTIKRKISELKFIKRNRSADPATVKILAKSIKAVGLMVPIIINPKDEIIDGERRTRAHTEAGLKNIECIVRDKDFEIGSIIANYFRKNYSGEEVTQRIKYMLDKGGMNQKEVAGALGLTAGRISQLLTEDSKDPEQAKRGGRQKKKPAKFDTSAVLPEGVAMRVTDKRVTLTFKLDELGMKDPLETITKRYKEIKGFKNVVAMARESL